MGQIVKLKDKEYEIKEVKYKDLINQENIADASPAQQAKRLMKLAIDITDEEFDNLSMKDGLALQKAINSVNGLEDFQKPLQE